MLWPEISGLGASLKFEVQMLLQRSDDNGNYTKDDTFAWAFLNTNGETLLLIAFEPYNDDSNSRSLAIYDSSNAKVELAEEILIAAGNLYELEVLMEPKYHGLNVNIQMVDMDINLTLPDCSTHNINCLLYTSPSPRD